MYNLHNFLFPNWKEAMSWNAIIKSNKKKKKKQEKNQIAKINNGNEEVRGEIKKF